MTYAKLSPRSIRMLGPSLAFCFVCAASVVAQARFDRAALIAAVDRAAGAAVEEHRLPGAGLVLVHAGKTMHARGFGVSNLTTKAPVDPDRTIFRIGSISKALSLLTLARFVDKGRIRMDTPVGGFVDGIRNPIGFDDPVRIRHLLTHTTGFDQLGGADRQIRNYSAELDARIAARPSLRSYLEGGRVRRVSRAGSLLPLRHLWIFARGARAREAHGALLSRCDAQGALRAARDGEQLCRDRRLGA